VSYQRLTFRRGNVVEARFSPDGASVIYEARLGDAPPQIFSAVPGHPEARPLFEPGIGLYDVSPKGELAVAVARTGDLATLARVEMAGGTPREVAEKTNSADWSPDGQLAAIIVDAGHFRLEAPLNHVLRDSTSLLFQPRVSPRGDAIAVVERAVSSDARGSILLLDRTDGHELGRFGPFRVIDGIAWAPDGALWAIVVRPPQQETLVSLRLGEPPRELLALTGPAELFDVSPDGRALFTIREATHQIAGRRPGSSREEDLSWFDGSDAMDLSGDGSTLLFYEAFEAAIPDRLTYMRDLRGAAAVQLAVGVPLALSPDHKWALVSPPPFDSLLRVPIGAGPTTALPGGDVKVFSHGFWFPDGKRVAVVGRAEGQRSRVWLVDLGGAPPRPITDEGVVTDCPPSPDGSRLAVVDSQGVASLLPVAGGPATPLEGLPRGDLPVQWTADGRFLYVRRTIEHDGDRPLRSDGYLTTRPPARILTYELATRKEKPFRDFQPEDPAGVVHIDNVFLTPDGKSYVYSYIRNFSSLYLVSGLR
jgi:Tol biopolymer transport system component